MVQQNPMGLLQYNHAPKYWHMDWVWNCNVLYLFTFILFFKKEIDYIFYASVLCDILTPTLQHPMNFNWKVTCQDNGFISFQMITCVLGHSPYGFFLMRPREQTTDSHSCEHQGGDSSWWHLRRVLLLCNIVIVELKKQQIYKSYLIFFSYEHMLCVCVGTHTQW